MAPGVKLEFEGGWRLSAAAPQLFTTWGTAVLCPSHPCRAFRNRNYLDVSGVKLLTLGQVV